MQLSNGIIYPAIVIAAWLAVKANKLTVSAAVTGTLVAVVIYAGAGLTALAALAMFFVLGSAFTKFGFEFKQQFGVAESNTGRRLAGQVLANAGVAALLAITCMVFPQHNWLFNIMIAGSFAAATADTLSSEIGMVYGSRFFNILTLKNDKRGLDGVISFEGLLAGVAGAMAIALVNYFQYKNNSYFLIITTAGFCGTLADSIIGAALERKQYITNNWVNFLNTLTGAVTAGLLATVL